MYHLGFEIIACTGSNAVPACQFRTGFYHVLIFCSSCGRGRGHGLQNRLRKRSRFDLRRRNSALLRVIAPNVDRVCIFDVALAYRPSEDQSGRPIRVALEMHLVRFLPDTLVPQVGDRSHECTYDLLLPQNAVPALHVDVGSLLRFVQRSLVLRRGGVSDALQLGSGAIWRVW